MGSKSGGGGRTPYYAPNTLNSKQKSKVVHLLGAGEFAGWKEGNEDPFRSIRFNDTPVKSKDGSFNFNGVRINWLSGAGDQNYLVGFDTVEKSISVGARVRKDYPVTQTITNPEITSLRIAVGTDVLYKQQDNGDVTKTRVALRVEIVKNNKVHAKKTWDIEEKSSSVYYQDLDFADLPDVPFSIRCVRDMADSNTDKLRNNTFFYSYVEQVGAKFSYPHCAMVGLEFDAEQFGTSMPTMTFDVKGKIIQVPSNYDPVARTYSGLWDGLFKPAFSNNPAWVMYDICTDEMDGFGRQLKGFTVDKAKLYEIGRYCDEMIDDGEGGKEPRFVFNGLIQGGDAYTVLNNVASVFRGMPVWLGDRLSFIYDRGGLGPVTPYTNANVVDGLFTYSHTPLSNIINSVQYEYADENDGCRLKVEELSNDQSIAKYRRLNVDKITVYGATKRSYAVRHAKWHLETAQTENEAVTFTVGRQGLAHEPYDIIEIGDNDFAGDNVGGRILSVDGAIVRFDRALRAPRRIHIFCQDGETHEFTVVKVLAGDTCQLNKAPNAAPHAVFTAWLDNVSPRLFRAISIQENTADGSYTISAVKYNPNKGKVVDGSASMGNDTGTTYNPVPQLNNPSATNGGDSIVLSWGSLAVMGEDVTYQINLFKDGKLYRSFNQKETELSLKGLPQGEYVARIRAKAGSGQYSDELVIAFSTTYTISALRTKPLLWGIQINWTVPPLLTSTAHTEIWYGKTDDITEATLLAKVTYPQTEFTLNDLSIGDEFYFWARLVDAKDNRGEFTASVKGQPSEDASSMLEYLDGQITNTQLGKDLLEQIQSGGQAGEDAKEALKAIAQETKDREAAILKEAKERAAAIAIETRDRNAAIAKETQARLAGIKLLDDGLTQEVIDRKKGDENLQGQVTTIKSSTDKNTAAIQTETTARTTADTALGKRIDTVVADNGKNSAAITAETTARATADTALGKRIDSVQATTGDNTAAITAEATARATADTALGKRVDTVSAETKGNTASIGQINKTVADNDKAHSERTDSLRASIGGNKGMIYDETLTNTISNGLEYTIESKGSGRSDVGFYLNAEPGSDVRFRYKITLLSGRIYSIGGHVGWLDNSRFSINGQQFVNYAVGAEFLLEVGGSVLVEVWGTWREGLQANPRIYVQPNRPAYDEKYTALVTDVYAEGSEVMADLTTFKQAQATKDEAMTKEISAATSQAGTNKAAITAEATTRANADKALGSRVDAVTATTNKNTASIGSLETVVADNQKAMTEKVESMSSEWVSSIEFVTIHSQAEADRRTPTWYTKKENGYQNKEAKELFDPDWIGLPSSKSLAYVSTYVTALTQTQNGVIKRRAVLNDKVYVCQSSGATVWTEWVNEVDNIHIGARNYAEDGLFDRGFWYFTKGSTTADSSGEIVDGRMRVNNNDGVSWAQWQLSTLQAKALTLLESNTEYTLSFVARINPDRPDSDPRLSFLLRANKPGVAVDSGNATFQLTMADKTYSHTFTTKDIDGYTHMRLMLTYNNRIGSVDIHNVKIEKGNIATDWSPAPEDAQGFADKVSAELTEFKKTQTTVDEAQTQQITAATSQAATNKAAIATEATTRATTDTALGKRIDTTSATVGQNSASITQQSTAMAELNGKLSAQYTLQVQAIAGGKKAVAGMAVGVDGATGESQFIVMADKFAVYGSDLKAVFVTAGGKTGLNGDLIVDGSILGRHIRANQSISAPIITGGTITGNTINGATINGTAIWGGSLNIGNGNFTVNVNGELYAKNGRFEGTVYANKIEGDILRPVILTYNKPTTTFTGGTMTSSIANANMSRTLIVSRLLFKQVANPGGTKEGEVIIKVGGVEVLKIPFMPRDLNPDGSLEVNGIANLSPSNHGAVLIYIWSPKYNQYYPFNNEGILQVLLACKA